METHYCWVNACCYSDQCHNAGSGLRCSWRSEEDSMFCKKCKNSDPHSLSFWQLENEMEFQKGKRWEKINGRVVFND